MSTPGNTSDWNSALIFVVLMILCAAGFAIWAIAWVTAAPGRFVMWAIERGLAELERP